MRATSCASLCSFVALGAAARPPSTAVSVAPKIDQRDDHADQQLDQGHAALVAQSGDHGATAFTGADSPYRLSTEVIQYSCAVLPVLPSLKSVPFQTA